jgi:hypothetical protein
MNFEWNREQLLELSRSFQESRILLTAAELNLFDLLASGPRSVEDLCSAEGLHPRGLTILLDALASQGLVSKSSDGRYFLEDSMAAMLTKDGGDSILPMIMHANSMWQTWHNLTQVVRTGDNPHHMDVGSRSTDDMEAFIGAMHVIGVKMAASIAESIDLNRFHHLLDVGGASGTYAMAFLQKAPHMTATIFDLASVMEIARKRLSENNFADRVKLVAGDYDADELPGGHDLVLLSAVIHSNSRQANRNLFQKIYTAMEPGGSLLIRDYVMDETRTLPPSGAIFAVNMLVATIGGNSYTFDEICEDLAHAGLTYISKIREGQNMDQLVLATKP